MGTSAFSLQTTPEPSPDRGAGRYRAVVSDQWNAPVLPHGGVITALALRAMAAELSAPDETLRSVTTVFAAQVPPGPVDIDVTVLRRGRTMFQATATVRPVGADSGHTAMAVFGGTRHGFEFTDATIPDAPAPEECPSFRDPLPEGVTGFPPASFWERVESRVAMGHAPWHEWEPTSSERVYWYRFDDVRTRGARAAGCLVEGHPCEWPLSPRSVDNASPRKDRRSDGDPVLFCSSRPRYEQA
jgi:acyl-CoA thioesterase